MYVKPMFLKVFNLIHPSDKGEKAQLILDHYLKRSDYLKRILIFPTRLDHLELVSKKSICFRTSI